MRKLYLAGIAFVALSMVMVLRGPAPASIHTHPEVPVVTARGAAADWFFQVKQFCNVVEVDTRLRWTPAPDGMQGSAYTAACYALAGRVETARDIILSLEGDDRWRAAGIVFNVAHPVADAGDDRSAGPIMEMVVEFWPNHYMALYHAGIARYGLGDGAAARDYLERFLQHYDIGDGFTTNAITVLEELGAR
jgi:hypothetical protein